jgi:hypothetical protein
MSAHRNDSRLLDHCRRGCQRGRRSAPTRFGNTPLSLHTPPAVSRWLCLPSTKAVLENVSVIGTSRAARRFGPPGTNPRKLDRWQRSGRSVAVMFGPNEHGTRFLADRVTTNSQPQATRWSPSSTRHSDSSAPTDLVGLWPSRVCSVTSFHGSALGRLRHSERRHLLPALHSVSDHREHPAQTGVRFCCFITDSRVFRDTPLRSVEASRFPSRRAIDDTVCGTVPAGTNGQPGVQSIRSFTSSGCLDPPLLSLPARRDAAAVWSCHQRTYACRPGMQVATHRLKCPVVVSRSHRRGIESGRGPLPRKVESPVL